jgi:hypothetical protein
MSPILCGIYSRARWRSRLVAPGLLDERLPRFSLGRKVFHPVRSLRALSWAGWAGVADPREAVAGWEASVSRGAPREPALDRRPLSDAVVDSLVAEVTDPGHDDVIVAKADGRRVRHRSRTGRGARLA